MKQKKQLILNCGKDQSAILGNRYNIPQKERSPARNTVFLHNINFLRIYPTSIVSRKLRLPGIYFKFYSLLITKEEWGRSCCEGSFISSNLKYSHLQALIIWSYYRVFLVPSEYSDHHQPHCAAVAMQNALDSLGNMGFF